MFVTRLHQRLIWTTLSWNGRFRATSPAGLIAKISKKVLVWSFGWRHWMLLLVQFPKLVSDQSKVPWMSSSSRRHVWMDQGWM